MSEHPTDPAPPGDEFFRPTMVVPLPPPPVFPEPGVTERLTTLSDAMFADDGRVSQIIGKVDKALDKLDAILRLLVTLTNESSANRQRIEALEYSRRRHSGALSILLPPEVLATLDGDGGSNGAGE